MASNYPTSTPLAGPAGEVSPQEAAELLAQAKQHIQEAALAHADVVESLHADIESHLQEAAAGVDAVAAPLHQYMADTIADCDSTLRTICQRLVNGAYDHLEKVWNQSIELGVALPALGSFLAPHTYVDGSEIPGSPTVGSVDYIGPMPAVAPRNEPPSDGVVTPPAPLLPPADRNYPTTPISDVCCPPGTIYDPADGGWCVSSYDGSRTRPSGYPNQSCGGPGPAPAPVPGPALSCPLMRAGDQWPPPSDSEQWCCGGFQWNALADPPYWFELQLSGGRMAARNALTGEMGLFAGWAAGVPVIDATAVLDFSAAPRCKPAAPPAPAPAPGPPSNGQTKECQPIVYCSPPGPQKPPPSEPSVDTGLAYLCGAELLEDDQGGGKVAAAELPGRGRVLAEGGERVAQPGPGILPYPKSDDGRLQFLHELNQRSAGACGLLVELRDLYIEFGKCVLVDESDDGQHLQPRIAANTFLNALTKFWFNDWVKKGQIIGTWRAAVLSDDWSQWWDHYQRPLRQLMPHRSQEAMWLLACLQALESLASYRWAGSSTQGFGTGQTGGISLGLGGSIGIASAGFSGGSESHAGRDRNIGFAASAAVLVLPMVETCRWFLEQIDPYKVPSVAEINNCYLRGAINLETYRCLMRVSGTDPALWDAFLWAARTSLDPLQYVMLWRRGQITEDGMNDRLREAGLIDPKDRAALVALTEVVPGPGDLVRFMTRDVEDQKIVDAFNLDAFFKDKFTGRVEEWAKAQGVSAELMLREWRAHWRAIGIGQGYEALHRQRAFDRKGRPNPLYTSIDHLRLLLAQDDVPQFWIDRLIADSYRVLGRVDVRRMRNLGIISADDVVELNQDGGYTEDDAKLIAQFTERERVKSLRNLPTVKLYIQALVSAEKVAAELDSYGASGQEKEQVYKWVQLQQTAAERKTCMAALKRQYMTGGVSDNFTTVELQQLGIEAEQVDRIMRRWNCERDYRGRVAPASQLCDWYVHGLLTRAEFGSRLVIVGYSPQDAERIILRCEGVATEKARKAAEATMKKIAADQQKAQQRLQAEQDKSKKAAERQAKVSEKVAANRRKREKELRKAAELMAQHTGQSVASQADELTNQIDRLMRDHDYDREAAELLAADAAAVWPKLGLDSFSEVIDSVQEATEDIDDSIDQGEQAESNSA